MDVAGIQFTLNYDAEALTLTGVTATDRTEQMDIFSWNEPSPGQARVLLADMGGDVVAAGMGPIAILSFEVAPFLAYSRSFRWEGFDVMVGGGAKFFYHRLAGRLRRGLRVFGRDAASFLQFLLRRCIPEPWSGP